MSKMKIEKETLDQRIDRERHEMNLAPWQLAPSEVDDDGPSPWPESTAGFVSWKQAQQWRREIRERDPNYFTDGDEAATGE